MTEIDVPPRTHDVDRSRGAVAAISLGAFSLVIGEFMPVGMLGPMAASLGVSEGTAGVALTATAMTAAVVGPVSMTLFGSLDRRTVLLVLSALTLASNIVTVCATGGPSAASGHFHAAAARAVSWCSSCSL
ncbi:hypothetical protein [Gordonia sp. NPDC003376]